jgi:hypothetical protein
MRKRHILLTMLFCFLALIGVAVVTNLERERISERDAMENQLSREIRADLLLSISRYVEELQKFPEGFNDLFSNGYYSFTPVQFDQMVELGHNDTPGGMPVLNYLNERFREAEREYRELKFWQHDRVSKGPTEPTE